MTLAELIDSEPANAGRTDQAVLDWLDEVMTSWQDVSWLELTVWLHESGITRADLSTAAAGTGATATAAQHIIDCVAAGQVLSASDSRIRSLINASSLSGAAKASLTAAAQTSSPRWASARDVTWTEATSDNVRLDDVANTRAN